MRIEIVRCDFCEKEIIKGEEYLHIKFPLYLQMREDSYDSINERTVFEEKDVCQRCSLNISRKLILRTDRNTLESENILVRPKEIPSGAEYYINASTNNMVPTLKILKA